MHFGTSVSTAAKADAVAFHHSFQKKTILSEMTDEKDSRAPPKLVAPFWTIGGTLLGQVRETVGQVRLRH
jgi:hypothetical protein